MRNAEFVVQWWRWLGVASVTQHRITLHVMKVIAEILKRGTAGPPV